MTRTPADRLTALETEVLHGAIREHYLPLRDDPPAEYKPSLVRYCIMADFMISERTFWAHVRQCEGR